MGEKGMMRQVQINFANASKGFKGSQMNEQNESVMDVGGACGYLKISERKLRALISDNEIPYFKIGKAIRFHKEALDKWCMRKTIKVG